MKNGNIIEIALKKLPLANPENQKPFNGDLADAIANLIYRLRELGPIASTR